MYFLATYSLFHCDLTPLTFDLYLSLNLSVQSYLELFRELNELDCNFGHDSLQQF